MATVLGLAMRITADASGLAKSLTPVERSLQQLGQQADKSAVLFDRFKDSTTGAADAQANVQRQFSELTNSLQSGVINAEEFATQFAAIQQSARETADAFARGAAVTEQAKTAEERRAEQLAELNRLLELGAISQETFDRAAAGASGANAAAAEAERERASAIAEANRIIQANLTPQERYDAQIVELQKHLEAGRLTQDQFNRAQARAKSDLDKSSQSAEKADKSLQGVTRQLRLISTIEIGRAIVDSFQLLTNAARSVVNQISSVVSNVSSSLDALNDLSNRIDVPVEKLQGLGLAAKLAGVDTEQFATAVTRLGVSIGKADPGGGFDKTLQSIGVSLNEIRGLSPEDQFAQIAEAIGSLPTSADQAAAAVEVFGRQGAALVPLFKDGAASVTELAERAERLGIVVGRDQVANIADMNDAFDLVRATIDGIIGQVVGNLAPVVTAISEEFLAFVESFQGVSGEGGGGIANAITDVLLNGAEVLAGVFDSFVGQLGGFSDTLSGLASTFEGAADVFRIVSNSLSVAFNAFETAGNGIALALGKVLESIGSYLDADLEQYGKELAAASQQAIDANVAELTAAATGVAEATVDLLSGDSANEAGQGQAQQFIAGLRERIEQERLPAVRLEADVEETRGAFDRLFNGLVDQSSKAAGLMREFEAALAAAQEDGELTADEIARLNDLQEGVNNAISRELQLRAAATEEAKKQAAEDAKRVDALLKVGEAAEKVRADLAAVEREQARIAEQIASGKLAGDALAQAEQRQQQLSDLSDKLEEDALAATQGFSDGFEKAFTATDKGFAALILKAEELGPTSATAIDELRAGIERAQNQAAGGIITKEAYDLEIERQKQVFDNRIKQIEEEAKFRLEQEEAADALLFAAQFGYDSERVKAAENFQLLQDQIRLAEEAIAKARAEGDGEALAALNQRLAGLDQAAAREFDIASGAAKAREEQEKLAQKAREDQQKIVEKQLEDQRKVFEEQRKAAEAEAKRQQERIRALNTLGAQVVQGGDVRTAEGAALVQRLAAEAQDPALIEQRRQTKLLQQISAGIAGAAANYFDSPVEIVGFARIGGIP